MTSYGPLVGIVELLIDVRRHAPMIPFVKTMHNVK